MEEQYYLLTTNVFRTCQKCHYIFLRQLILPATTHNKHFIFLLTLDYLKCFTAKFKS